LSVIFYGNLDIDLMIVNQIMHTFTKQTGYLKNNMTGEYWSWSKD